jgi:hypothetical protein
MMNIETELQLRIKALMDQIHESCRQGNNGETYRLLQEVNVLGVEVTNTEYNEDR